MYFNNSISLWLATTEALTNEGTPYSISLTLVYVVGFIAAAAIGSIAWYNSKRPPGWENKERPDVVPKVDTDEPGT
jgi:hypothetical protein